MSQVLRQYPCKPRWRDVLLGAGFFGACTATFVHLAATNEGGVVINGIIRLSPLWAKVFFWTLAGLSFAFVLGSALMAYMRLTARVRIAITADGMLFPTGRWGSGKECHVPFARIVAVKRLDYKGMSYLYVYADGLRYTVQGFMLPRKGDLEEIIALVRTKVGEGCELPTTPSTPPASP